MGKIFTQISVTKSEAYIKLDEEDFYEKKMTNKRKKWIMEGLDPDEEEEKFMNKIRNKKIKKKRTRKSEPIEDQEQTREEKTSIEQEKS